MKIKLGLIILTIGILIISVKPLLTKVNSESNTFDKVTEIITNPTPTPIHGMFYYPWFPETWSEEEITPFTHYQPLLGYYSSSESAIIKHHIQAMQYGGIDVGIFEWNGQGTLLDNRIELLLQSATDTQFHWAAYYNQEGLSVGFGPNPASEKIANDLTYINSHYGEDSSYMKIDGKPLVFVYGDSQDDCGMVERWEEANKDNTNYIVLKVFAEYEKCTDQPDGWHQYNPEKREDNQKGYSFTVSPGFWKANEQTPRLDRDPEIFTQNVRHMVESGAPFQLVVSFNEWGEGSAVENAQTWKSESGYGVYLDILHKILREDSK